MRKMWKRMAQLGFILCLIAVILAASTGGGLAAGMGEVGTQLPDFQLQAPESLQDRQYLGIGEAPAFSIDQVNTPFTLVEVVGVYCPQCHIQAPLFNTLFHRIRKDPEVDSKVRMLAIAIGATPQESAYMKETFTLPFPLLRDPDFTVHKLLGEPRTPLTMIVAKDKRIVFSHLGVIEDMDGFMQQIQALVK